MVEYYTQRTTPGGLLITEATPISLPASGFPGVPGIFTKEQQIGWKKVVDAVHTKGGRFMMQLWHQGRTTHSVLTGTDPVGPSSTPITKSEFSWPPSRTSPRPFEIPKAMSLLEIRSVIDEYTVAAEAAIKDVGFDGVEIHAGNGYLPDQFLHSNINTREDEYGGSLEKRCRFLLELVEEVGKSVGLERVGVRLAPFGYFNESEGQDRIQQWTYLCQRLAEFGLGYVHLIEPRFDEFLAQKSKLLRLEKELNTTPSLDVFKEALGSTPCIVAGGYDNHKLLLKQGKHDAIAFGRFFCSNEDLVERLRTGQKLYAYDRSRFYGPFEDNEIGYTKHPNRFYVSEDFTHPTSHGE